MVKAAELRIGSLVNSKYSEEDAAGDMVSCIGIESIESGADLQHVIDFPHSYDPIPLTPEILEACGFSPMPKFNKYAGSGNWRTSLDNASNEMQFDDREEYRLFSYNGCFLWKSPKHLHQLQNLYFALTGEELEVKL